MRIKRAGGTFRTMKSDPSAYDYRDRPSTAPAGYWGQGTRAVRGESRLGWIACVK